MNINKDLILTPYHILPNGTKEDWTKELEYYGYRTMWQILQTCALTIIACTWITIHPNIPSHWCTPSRLYYKVQLWIVALVMPELLLLWAVKQFIAAWDLTKRKVGDGEKVPLLGSRRWTMKQAFFALMGGCEGKGGRILSPYAPTSIKMPTDEEILDKSKQDALVKFLTIAQTLWFVVSTVYRIQSQKLFATEAEIVTFTFACLSAFTNGFWWCKPKDVNLPLPCDPNPTPSDIPHASTNDSNPTPADIPHASTNDLKSVSQPKTDALTPNCFELATSIMQSDNGNTHHEFIPNSDVYAYDGDSSSKIPVLFASFLGSLSGVPHLIISTLHGFKDTRVLIWFWFAFVGSTLSFYLLLATPIYMALNWFSEDWGKGFRRYALHKYVKQAFLIVSAIGRIALFLVLIYFTFFPYDFRAFLTPKWSQYIPHPF